MDYLDCKALSEVVETHERAFAALMRVHASLSDTGVDIASYRRAMAPALLALVRSYRIAQRQYERACELYLASLPRNPWSGQAATGIPTPADPVRATL